VPLKVEIGPLPNNEVARIVDSKCVVEKEMHA